MRLSSPPLRALVVGLCCAGAAHAADPPAKAPAAAKAKAADKILTPAQLRDCLAQQAKVKQQDADADKQKAAIEAEKDALGKLEDTLAAQLAAVDRTNQAAVDAYNEQVQARAKRIEAYEASVDQYNARVVALNTDQETYAKSCNNRRYLEDDETAIKKGK